LRERSQKEGRSLNAVAVDLLWRGLGKGAADHELRDVLGALVAETATSEYAPHKVEERVAPLGEQTRHLADALDWTRGDR
jgi:hypothetical protein